MYRSLRTQIAKRSMRNSCPDTSKGRCSKKYRKIPSKIFITENFFIKVAYLKLSTLLQKSSFQDVFLRIPKNHLEQLSYVIPVKPPLGHLQNIRTLTSFVEANLKIVPEKNLKKKKLLTLVKKQKILSSDAKSRSSQTLNK